VYVDTLFLAEGSAPLNPFSDQRVRRNPKSTPITYVHVTDVDAITAKARQLGGTIHREPTDIPNIGRFAVLADPTGAVFGIFKGAGS